MIMQYQTYLEYLEQQTREKEVQSFLDTLKRYGIDDITKDHLKKYKVIAIDIHDDPLEFHEYLSACTRRSLDFPYSRKEVLDVKYIDELNYPTIKYIDAFDVTKTHVLLREFVKENNSGNCKFEAKCYILHVYPAITIEGEQL
jgi:hypothetical protein